MLLRNYKERGVLIMAKFGYVKIVSGQAARRIVLASIALLTILQNRT